MSSRPKMRKEEEEEEEEEEELDNFTEKTM